MKQLILFLFLSVNLFSQDLEPPGKQVAQINVYKVDSFTYEISYFDPEVFDDVEELYYSIFQKVVVNNYEYIYMWVDEIIKDLPTEAAMEHNSVLPDSIQLKLLDYYFSKMNKQRNGNND